MQPLPWNVDERSKNFQALRQIIEAVNGTRDVQAVLQEILEVVSFITHVVMVEEGLVAA